MSRMTFRTAVVVAALASWLLTTAEIWPSWK